LQLPGPVDGKERRHRRQGKSATVGLKDGGPQGSNRLLLVYNNGPTALVGSNKSVQITRGAVAADLYSFALAAGDTTTLAVKAQTSGLLNVDLLKSDGTTVAASGVAGPTNLDKIISSYTVAAGAGGTYYARVTGAG